MTILICIIGKLFNRKVNKIMFLSGLFLLGFLYSVQLCVFKMFGFYFDWTLIGASGQIASFAGDGLNLIIANIIGLILNFMPFILFLIYNRIIVIEKDDVKANIVKIVLCVLTGLSFYGVLNIKRDEVNSPYKLYTSVNNVDLNVRTFGVVNAFFIDTYRNIFGFEEIIDIPNKPRDDVNNNDGNDNVGVKNYEYNNLDIDFDKLPTQFVLKCTHDSGGLVVCKDKSNLNKKAAKKKIEKSMKTNYYKGGREWPYKNVKPRIIAEEYMEDISGNGLTDYKFYCFNGVPKYLYVSNGMDNHETARLSFLTMNWEKAPFGRSDYLEFEVLPPKPTKFDEMVKIAKSLSGGHPFLRVDLYEINNKVYFSELTFSPCGGFMPFVPEEWDAKLGEMVNIRKVK